MNPEPIDPDHGQVPRLLGHDGGLSRGPANRPSICTIPNAISASRLLLLAPTWYAAVTGERVLLGVLLGICAGSDFLDGFLARRWNQTSSFGARLDSVADDVLTVSALAWTWLVAPELVRDHPFALPVLATLLLLVFALMLALHGRIVEIHTYAARLGVTVMWVFLIWTSLVGYSGFLGLLFVLTSGCYLAEDVLLLVLRRHIDEHDRGLFFASARAREDRTVLRVNRT